MIFLFFFKAFFVLFLVHFTLFRTIKNCLILVKKCFFSLIFFCSNYLFLYL